MASQIQDTYTSPVKSALLQNVNSAQTSKTTATTALSENSGFKDPADAAYMKLKKLSSATKSFCISKLIEESKGQSDLISQQSSSAVGNHSATKAEHQ